MASGLAGDQWNEGDVSCSVVRRIVLPDSFFALDGLYETTFAVLRDFGMFPEVVAKELQQYLPFLATTKLLIHGVKAGLGREQAHEVVKKEAVAAALEGRRGANGGVVLLERLADSATFPGDRGELDAIVNDANALLGTIDGQIDRFCQQVGQLADGRDDIGYRGSDIL